MKIQFDANGVLKGSHTIKYLLEKSRIVTAGPGERVYHSFYLLMRSAHYRQVLGLKEDAQYQSLASGNMLHNGDYDTQSDFDGVVRAMKTVGLNDSDVDSAWAVVAGVAELLNLKFCEKGGACEGVTTDQSFQLWVKSAIKHTEYTAIQPFSSRCTFRDTSIDGISFFDIVVYILPYRAIETVFRAKMKINQRRIDFGSTANFRMCRLVKTLSAKNSTCRL